MIREDEMRTAVREQQKQLMRQKAAESTMYDRKIKELNQNYRNQLQSQDRTGYMTRDLHYDRNKSMTANGFALGYNYSTM